MAYSVEGSRTNDTVSGGFVDLAAVVVLEFLLGDQHALDLVEFEFVVVRLGWGNLQHFHVGCHFITRPVGWSFEKGFRHEAGFVHLAPSVLAGLFLAEERVALVSSPALALLPHLDIQVVFSEVTRLLSLLITQELAIRPKLLLEARVEEV